MAAMTLSNHVLTATAVGDTWADWVCIERIIWRGATSTTDLLEVNDKNGKSVLEPVRAGLITVEREVEMNSKWANGLEVIALGDAQDTHQLNFYLRQEPRE